MRTRSPYILLRLLEEYLVPAFDDGCKGLCFVIGKLENEGIIDIDEYWTLYHIIQANKPRPSLYHKIFGNTNYFYTPGRVRPRKRWIRRMLKLYYPENL
jgi:hypothetical protein